MHEFGLLSILPIFCAIILAISIRQIAVALMAACLLSAFILTESIFGAFDWLLLSGIVKTLSDADHIKIILFSLMIGSIVNLLNQTNASQAFIRALGKLTKTRSSTQVSMWFSGMVIFFDDYANCLIIGNAMRTAADKMRISREKLAYIVDSTAAPIASISLVSTWIAFQVGLIDNTFKDLGITSNAYEFFVESIPYNFYAVLTLLFVFLIAYSGKDFGPMKIAEETAQKEKSQEEKRSEEGMASAWQFALPICCLMVGTLGIMFFEGSNKVGMSAPLYAILGAADSYNAMLKGSFLALLLTIILSMLKSKISLQNTMTMTFNGFRELLEPLTILILAWVLSSALSELGTATYMVQILKNSIPSYSLPTLVFVVSAALAFATGTSFGTLGLMIPTALPIAIALSDSHAIHLASCASIMGGAVLGDHASPISDTTIMSSMGSGCDHMAHVKTQLPYALLVGLIAVVFGTIPTGLGAPPILCLLSGLFACWLSLQIVSRRGKNLHLPRFVT